MDYLSCGVSGRVRYFRFGIFVECGFEFMGTNVSRQDHSKRAHPEQQCPSRVQMDGIWCSERVLISIGSCI